MTEIVSLLSSLSSLLVSIIALVISITLHNDRKEFDIRPYLIVKDEGTECVDSLQVFSIGNFDGKYTYCIRSQTLKVIKHDAYFRGFIINNHLNITNFKEIDNGQNFSIAHFQFRSDEVASEIKLEVVLQSVTGVLYKYNLAFHPVLESKDGFVYRIIFDYAEFPKRISKRDIKKHCMTTNRYLKNQREKDDSSLDF